MAIQQRHINNLNTQIVTQASFNSAKFLGGLSGLSQQSTVLLFRLMVLNERVKTSTKKPIVLELVRNGFVSGMSGMLMPWVAAHMGEAIELLVAESGCDIMPQATPTSIQQLGHKQVKGKSKTSKLTGASEKIMRETAFKINRRVLALAWTKTSMLSKYEEVMLQTALHAGSLPEVFYFPISYDYRGRMYYRGGLFSPQGSDFQKALLQFAECAPIGRHGQFAISMALADACGIKGTKRQQKAWADSVDLRTIADAQYGWVAAGLAMEMMDLRRWVDEGNDAELFESGIICHMDATCSALQIGAAITGCRTTAEATNCTARTAEDGKADVYQRCSDDLLTTKTRIARLCSDFGRKVTKYPVMLLGYGAGKETVCRRVEEFVLAQTGKVWEMDDESADALMESLGVHCAATMELKEQFQEFVKRSGESFGWTTHDGFQVVHDKRAGEEVSVGSFSMVFDQQWDEDLNARALAPNFVHSLDAAQMREAIRLLGNVPVASIHDSLGVRPCDYVNAARAVRLAFVAIDAQGITKRLFEEQGIKLNVLGNYKPTECLDSSYFWC